MSKASMENGTWGELRTLNSNQLAERMVSLGKGNRIEFKTSLSSEQSWVIITREEFEQIIFDHARIKNLEMRLKTIVNVAEL